MLEQVTRRCLSVNSEPAMLFISHLTPNFCTTLARTSDHCNATHIYGHQKMVVEPIAQHYGAAMVSYRDLLE